MKRMKKMIGVALAVLCLAQLSQAQAAEVYDNVTIALAGIREDGVVSGNITSSAFGSKWIELDINTATGRAMLAVMLTAVSTEKTVAIYASQDATDVNVFNIHWMNIAP